jgi:hypothetical protein
VLQLHEVDANTRIFRLVLYNSTFFRIGTAENRLPTAADEPIHAKEFLYTTPQAYGHQVQLRSLLGALIHQ